MAFRNVFAGSNLVTPTQPVDRLDEIVAWLAGVNLHTGLLGTSDRGTWERLQPYALESLTLWQQARVASVRTIGGDHTRSVLVLLRRGDDLNRASDPVAFLRDLLGDEPLR